MRQIVPDEVSASIAMDRGEDAVFDLDLYNRIFRTHFLDAFDAWCKERQLDFGSGDEEFNAGAYVKKLVARTSNGSTPIGRESFRWTAGSSSSLFYPKSKYEVQRPLRRFDRDAGDLGRSRSSSFFRYAQYSDFGP